MERRKDGKLFMDVTHITLRPGVRLTAVRTAKFKSSVLAVRLLTSLHRAKILNCRHGIRAANTIRRASIISKPI